MRRYSITLILLLSTTMAFGQSKSLEGLLKDLEKAKEDTVKVSLLINIERKYFTRDLDSALYYNTLCEDLIIKINAVDYKHRCYHDFVKIYHAKNDYKKALEYCLKSIKVAKHNRNRFQEATSYRAIFNIYHNLKMNDSAVKYAVQSINLTTEIGDTTNVATNYGNLTWLYKDMSQYKKAVEYGLKGIEAGEHYQDTIGLLISLNNLALCYIELHENNKAIELFKRQYIIGKKIDRPRSIRNALINLGLAYYSTGAAKELEKTTTLLNDYNRGVTDLDSKNRCYQYLTNAYNFIYRKEFLQAEKQLLAAMDLAKRDSLTDPLFPAYITMSQVKFSQHDFVAGNYYEEKWDSLYNLNTEQQLSEYAAELETKYEVEKKESVIHHLETEKEIQQFSLQRKNSFIIYLISGMSALIIISFLTYRNIKHKQKIQQQRISELETLQQLTATEAVLKGEEQERTRIAKDLHDGLGGILSGIKFSFTTMKGNLVMTPENQQAFERSMDMLDSSIRELRRVAHNMMPEALLRFGLDAALKDFCYEINESGAVKINYLSFGPEDVDIDQTVAITLYRIVQELINNTMKHSGASSAIVQLTKSNEQLSLTVEDDGNGFDPAILKTNKGMGWVSIKNRVDFLKGKLDVTSKEGEGTSVHIEILL